MLSLLARHWLTISTLFLWAIVLLAFLAPALVALGFTELAEVLYSCYRWFCHQDPTRSFFLWGHPLALCQRDTAAFASAALSGVLYIVGDRVRPLPRGVYLLMLAPLIADSAMQIVGLHQSTALLRAVTGGLAGAGSVWFFYPRMAAELRRATASVKTQRF